MARPTKYDEDRAKRIIDALRAGNTRRAACAFGGISEDSFTRWLARYAGFAEQVTVAEAQCEVENVAILKKAANGYKTKTTRTKSKSEVVRNSDGEPLIGKNGEPVTVLITETVTTEGFEFDWRASLEWLKRRQRAEWGDSIDIRKLDDETLLRLLARLDEEEAATRGGAAEADRPGHTAAAC